MAIPLISLAWNIPRFRCFETDRNIGVQNPSVSSKFISNIGSIEQIMKLVDIVLKFM